MPSPIFETALLNEHLPSFNLNSVVGLRKKRALIQNWLDSFASNKVDYFKEEEVKSRFIMEIFGQLLGFNYKNPGIWLCREEVKTQVDGTKPDAALGVFRATRKGVVNEVRVVVEIKDINTNLDKPQNRASFKITPVDQAFLYASKMGGGCKWVVVSNFQELRFYHHSDQGRYQSYRFEDLTQDAILTELLFLFHKDHWTNGVLSVTDKLYSLKDKLFQPSAKSSHLLDQLYHLLHKFEGLEFVDPNYIANLKPLNVLSDHVWHFSQNTLYTINPEVHELLIGITNNDGDIKLDIKLEKGLKKAKVQDARRKIKYIFTRLHQFLIKEICAIKNADLGKLESNASLANRYRYAEFLGDLEQLRRSTYTGHKEVCECVNCNYRSLDFKKLIEKAKGAKINHSMSFKELAYIHYQLATDNFRESYYIYKNAEQESKGVENKNLEYFLTKINLTYLHNLVSGYDDKVNSEILNDIKMIDLDRSIHNELDIYVDEDVRKYLIRIKEFGLFNQIEKKIAELVDEIRDKQTLFNNGGSYSGPNHLEFLNHQYHLLYSHFHKNYIIYDAFSDFEAAVANVFEGLLLSYQTKGYGLTHFNEFYLIEAVIYIPRMKLQEIVNNCSDLAIKADELGKFIRKAVNFLTSLYENHAFGVSANLEVKAQLTNFKFQHKFENIFSNLFTLLTRLTLSDEQTSLLAKPIIGFIQTEDFLAHYDLRELGKFLERYPHIFKRYEVVDLLNRINNHTHKGFIKYSSLTKSLCKVYAAISANKPLSESSVIRRAIVNIQSDDGHFAFSDVVCYYPILDTPGQDYFKQQAVNSLTIKFETFNYEILLENNVLHWQEYDFFNKYINLSRPRIKYGDPVFEGENYKFKDATSINLITHIYHSGVPRNIPAIASLSQLSPFSDWALFPDSFDYTSFEPRWLLLFQLPQILKEMAKVPEIKLQLVNYLPSKPNSNLASIYFEYFI